MATSSDTNSWCSKEARHRNAQRLGKLSSWYRRTAVRILVYYDGLGFGRACLPRVSGASVLLTDQPILAGHGARRDPSRVCYFARSVWVVTSPGEVPFTRSGLDGRLAF